MIWQSNLKDYLFLPCKTVYFRKTIKFAQYIGRRSVNCNKIRESMISCVGFFSQMGGDLRGGSRRGMTHQGCNLQGQLGRTGAQWAWHHDQSFLLNDSQASFSQFAQESPSVVVVFFFSAALEAPPKSMRRFAGSAGSFLLFSDFFLAAKPPTVLLLLEVVVFLEVLSILLLDLTSDHSLSSPQPQSSPSFLKKQINKFIKMFLYFFFVVVWWKITGQFKF